MIKINQKKAQNLVSEISRKLALNYIDASLNPNDADFGEIANEYLKKGIVKKGTELRSRNIFILGAGASKNGFPKIFKNGDEAATSIEDELGLTELKENKLIGAKYNEIKSKLLLGKSEKNPTFETRLSVLSHFVPISDIRTKISEIFNQRTYPSVFYEILAHIFKNRFVDAIINFNFDESFDQAVIEEISTGELKKVISDGDCVPYNELIDDHILKIPLYIKPHGTFSEKSSLRFTKEQYIDIPQDIDKLITSVFLGYEYNQKPEKNELFAELNLICCGFEMEGVEFNTLIKKVADEFIKNADRKINIYFLQFDTDKKYSNEKKQNPYNRLKEEFKDYLHKISIKIIKNEEYPKTLSDTFFNQFIKDLWKNLMDNFKEGNSFRPRAINRHEVFLDLIKEAINEEGKVELKGNRKRKYWYFNSPLYLLDRLIYEILIVICKNNGVIQLEESLKSTNRIGLYYQYLSKMIEVKFDILGEILKCLGLSKRKISFGRGMYVVPENINISVFQYCHESSKNSFEEIINFNKIRTKKIFIKNRALNIFKTIQQNGKSDYFENLHKGLNANIYPNFSNINDHIFKNIEKRNIICTDLALFNFKKIGIENCNAIFLISDKGSIIQEFTEEIEKKGIQGYVVYSENHNIDKPKKMRNFNYVPMPFYDHSRHMTLFANIIGDNVTLHSCIYFYKKGFSNNVNAIYLDQSSGNEDSLENLFKTFLTYWMKAEYYSAFGSLPYIKEKADIKQIYGIELSEKEESNLSKIESSNNSIQIVINEYIKSLVRKIYQI